MKQVPSEKFCVAWFKLAEFVARGEKERALALYRLLAHSLDDKALASQLEGDLLLSFNDEMAVGRYYSAAQLYQKEGKLMHSAAIFEQLLTLDSTNVLYLHQVLHHYKNLNQPKKMVVCLKALINFYSKQGDYPAMNDLIAEFKKTFDDFYKADIAMHATLRCIDLNADKPFIKKHMQQAVDHAVTAGDAQQLQTFMLALESLNAEWHTVALAMVRS